MSFSILFYSFPVIPLLLLMLSSMMEKPVSHWMIFLTIVQLMLILMTTIMALISLHWETKKEVQVNVVGKFMDRELVVRVELTVNVEVFVVLVKVYRGVSP